MAKKRYKYVGTYARDLPDGRVVAPGEEFDHDTSDPDTPEGIALGDEFIDVTDEKTEEDTKKTPAKRGSSRKTEGEEE